MTAKVYEVLVMSRLMSQARDGKPRRRPDTGEVLDRQYRTVQNPGEGEQATINLTNVGKRIHGFSSGDSLSVEVCENGVWIPADE